MILQLDTFDFLRRAAKIYGEKIALVDDEEEFTYGEFLRRSMALASNTKILELFKADVVSIINYNTHHLLESYFGLLRAGLVISPLNHRYSVEDLVFMINHAKSKAIFLHRDFLSLIRNIEPRIPTVKHFVVIEAEEVRLPGANYHRYEELTEAVNESWRVEVNENDVAELLFTSGTTLRPKCVPLTHRNLYLNALFTIIAYRMTDEDTLLHVVPLFHANGGGAPQTITAVGGKHVMLRKVSSDDMLRLIQRESVTMFVAVPTVIDRLLSHPTFESFDTSSMARIIVIGAPLTPNLIKRVEQQMPSCTCFSAYGMTETGPLIAFSRPKQSELGLPTDQLTKLKCGTGYEIIGAHVRVVDRSMRDILPGSQNLGEIIVRGNSIFNGYHNESESDASAFTNGWFRTGDIAEIQEGGWITIVDRKKDIIKSGGENISSIEIEEVIKRHPKVSDVAVIGIKDERWGETPQAIVELKPNMTLTEGALISYCRDNMAHFKVPTSVKFVKSFPRTVTGKISKQLLRAKHRRES